MVQFTHLRIAHTKISFYFGNPKSRGKICGARRDAGRMQRRAAEDGRQQAYGGLRRCTAENGIRVPAQKKRKATTFLSFGEPAGARTQDPNIKSVVLYLLSYGFSGTITAQTVLVVQMYGIYLKIQYPKTFFSCEAPYGSFFRSCPSGHRSCSTLFGHCGPVKLHPLQPPHGIASIIGTKAQLRNP